MQPNSRKAKISKSVRRDLFLKEVKTPKKTLIFYCIITLLVLLIFNTLLYPAMLNRAV